MQGLPPGTHLPDKHVYRKGQLKARLVVSAVGLIGLIVIAMMLPQQRYVTIPCIVVMFVLTAFNAVRFARCRP